MAPAPKSGGFRMEGYWIWCGSVIRDDDGLYHMFASRWPRELAFHPHWLTNSEIVRATSETPEGPYRFEEVVLPTRSAQYWDGRMTHNPTLHRSGDTYLLFYIGTTYNLPVPTASTQAQDKDEVILAAHRNQRIGLATAPSPSGPWTRQECPILEPRPGRWDGLITTNPAPCVLNDGRVLLVYKSTRFRGDLLRFGVAEADTFAGPYERLSDEPILNFDDSGDHVEDAFLWQGADGQFEMLMKDMRGGIGGEARAVIHANSGDCLHWKVSKPAIAFHRCIPWNDGTITRPAFLERPQLLLNEGRPTHLFAAIGEGPTNENDHTAIAKSWCAAIPLNAEPSHS